MQPEELALQPCKPASPAREPMISRARVRRKPDKTKGTTMKRIIVSLYRLSHNELLARTGMVLGSLNSPPGNGYFPEPYPAPYPSLAAIGADADALRAAMDKVTSTAVTAERHALRKPLIEKLRSLASYLELLAREHPERLAASGFALRHEWVLHRLRHRPVGKARGLPQLAEPPGCGLCPRQRCVCPHPRLRHKRPRVVERCLRDDGFLRRLPPEVSKKPPSNHKKCRDQNNSVAIPEVKTEFSHCRDSRIPTYRNSRWQVLCLPDPSRMLVGCEG